MELSSPKIEKISFTIQSCHQNFFLKQISYVFPEKTHTEKNSYFVSPKTKILKKGFLIFQEIELFKKTSQKGNFRVLKLKKVHSGKNSHISGKGTF